MKFGSVRIAAVLAILAAFFAAAFATQPVRAQGAPSAQVAQSTPAAQNSQGTLRGQVTDPSGAAVAGAAVVMMASDGTFTTGKTTQTGSYEIKGLAPGSYMLTINADGFSIFEQDNVQISPGQIQKADAKLTIATANQTVQVTGEAATVAVNPEENASAVVIQGKDLEALSDDPDELQDELEALAGPSAGPNGGQMYIDGFQAGQLPPKSAIREIIINQNPFSAEYPDMGYGRIQILTKPGTDKLHGDFFVIGNDSAFNTLTPFICTNSDAASFGCTADVPPNYHTVQFSGDVSGPLSKKASYFIQVEQRNIDQASIIDALQTVGPAPTFTIGPTLGTPLNPVTRTTISPRLDFQLTKTNTITIRYQFTHSGETGDGVGQSRLFTQAYNEADTENTVQITDDQTFGTKVLMETRFQYNHDQDDDTAQNTTAEIQVPGDFTGGGNPLGKEADHSTHYELDSFTQVTLARNTVRFGARLDQYVDTNTSTSNFNGTFQFPSINADQTFLMDSFAGMTDAEIIAAGGGANQYAVTFGNPTSRVSEFAVGLYAEDDWRIKPTITLSYGLRYETQTNISDHKDWAPRLSLSWAVGHSKSGPKTVLRAGYGIFYTRFNYTNTLDDERFNGSTQQQFVITNPQFFPDDSAPAEDCFTETPAPPSCPPPPPGQTESPTPQTIYQDAPNLRAPYQMELGGSVERQLTKTATLSLTYLNSHGLHQFLTDDVNAPLPGTYNPGLTSSGIRPLSAAFGNDFVDQFQSEGIFHQNQLIVNLNYKWGARVSIFGYYTLNYANSDTSGVGSFPSQPYNLMADYGRASFDVRNRVFFGGTINLPKGFRLNPLIAASSGSPFNITVGQDLMGDSHFNDRPGIASGPGLGIIDTPQFGFLNTDPTAGEAILPINDGSGPGQFTFNLRISKTFSFGGEPVAASNNTGQGGGPGGGFGGPGGGGPPGAGGGGGGGGRGGGGGGGGRGGPGGFGGGAPSAKRYNLTFSANIRNIFNIANLAVPSGEVGTPTFSQPMGMMPGMLTGATPNKSFEETNSVVGGIYGSTSSDRRIDLQMTFTF
jgi:Carboxypeptidase regulatory-like domain/TonB dependent receptor